LLLFELDIDGLIISVLGKTTRRRSWDFY